MSPLTSEVLPASGHLAKDGINTQVLQKVGAEMIGTFALVFVGCGAIMSNQLFPGNLGHLGICMSFGLIIMVMIYATGHISGAHFNPAVTIAFAAAGRFSWSQVPLYVTGQILAAILASYSLKFLLGGETNLGATLPSIGLGATFVFEVILTMFLMFVIISVATDSRAVGQMAGVAIGGTVMLEALFAGPLTGASMNPARSLGPALASGSFSGLWIYLTAPIVGALLGAALYHFIQCRESDDTKAGGCC